MPLDFLLERFQDLPATRSLIGRLPSPGKRIGVGGLPGSSMAVLVSALARALPQRVFTVIAPTPADGERWLADLQTLLGPDMTALYPQRESLGAEEPHYELAGERIETLEALLRGAVRVLITTARASAERTAVPAALQQARLVIEVNKEERRLTDTAQRLDAMGYERVPTVTEVAQYSVRGGILDVYGFGMATPARIEWWGDEVVSVRSFDLDTQRSGDALDRDTVQPHDMAILIFKRGPVVRVGCDVTMGDAFAMMRVCLVHVLGRDVDTARPRCPELLLQPREERGHIRGLVGHSAGV